ncbi:hypothetical protein NA56DRAFT_732994 [Hyaloscypha hepaticicola]|uniref:Uncharacterized protein n=1 Tax=Hyaloscypha hepaticicola TaxID=2082293 RepID=A0A2J6QIT1_9HELO|nr:hypothetical protein NA56DRAFT_732994 [Hyaloscypha hepaticicola]
MAASLRNQTLTLSAAIPFTATATPSPTSANKSPQWDAVAVYGFVFGFLAVLLAVPGTYLAIIALKKHRKHEARQGAMNDVEPGIEAQSSGLEDQRIEPDGVNGLDRDVDN